MRVKDNNHWIVMAAALAPFLLHSPQARAHESREAAQQNPASANRQPASVVGKIDPRIKKLREENAAALKVGDYARAAQASAQVIELAAKQSGRRSADYAQALDDHGVNLRFLGHSAEAEKLHRSALELRTELLGEKHPDTLTSLGNLAVTLSALGREREVEALDRRAVALKTEVFGDKHPNTLTSLNNLAATLNALGRSAEAEPLVRHVLAVESEVLGAKHPSTINGLNNLAAILHALGRVAEAEPLDRRALALQMEVLGEKHPDTLTSLSNLAVTLSALGREQEAEALDRRAIALRMEVLGDKHPDTLTSLNNLAATLAELGRSNEAEPLFRRAVALRMEVLGEKHPNALESLNNLAATLGALGRATEAEPLNRRVLALRVEALGEKHPDTLNSLNNLASNLRRLGRSAEAEPLNRKALALSTEVLGEKHPYTITILGNLASTLDKLGRLSEAEPLHRRAFALTLEVLGDSHPLTLSAAGNLASTLLSQPVRAGMALQPARAGATGWKLRRRTIGSSVREERQLGRDVERQQEYYELLANAAYSAAEVHQLPLLQEEAFGALQDAMAGSTSQAVALMAARHAAEGAATGLGALARERHSLSDRWGATEAALTAALGQSGPEAAVKRENLRKQQSALEAEMTQIDDRLRDEAPEYFALIRPEPLDLAAAQRLLAPDEAAVLVVPTKFGTHVMAVTRDGLSWHRSAMVNDDIAEAVRRLRRDLTRPASHWNLSFDRQAAYRLYSELIAPVAKVLRGKSHVFIAADGSLASLPFAVLVTRAPSGDDSDPAALKSTAWFNDNHALVQIPSLQSLHFLRNFASRKVGSTGFQGFGDPVLEGVQLDDRLGSSREITAASVVGRATRDGRAVADVSRLRQLAPLPGTAIELERLRQALGAPPSSVKLRNAATESAVKSANLSRTGIIAFATHGLVAGEIKGLAEPGLVFTPPAEGTATDDGLLTASEITTLKLDADWVILSACNTAAGDAKGASGLSGLARAFFYAGAQSLLASHWPIRDDVAAELTVDVVTRQRRNQMLTKAQALQATMQAIRNSSTDDTRAHPGAWAPFALIGEGAR